MKFWTDELRICPKCKHKVNMQGEAKIRCSACNTRVWFFNFQHLAPPPELPVSLSSSICAHPTTTLLLISTGLLALVALVAVYSRVTVSAVSALVAVGFGVFAFYRHFEASKIEERLDQADNLDAYASRWMERSKELTHRYQALLQVGNERIEHYYSTIYTAAERERDQALQLQAEAAKDRNAVRDVEDRINSMAERFVRDHLKWVAGKLRPDPENYQRNKLQLTKSFDFVESVGYTLPTDIRSQALANLKNDYKQKVREQTLKDEQRRLKQQMREEEKIRLEREQARLNAERHEAEIQERLQLALRQQTTEHDAQVEELKSQLLEAQAISQRAKSMAELTKCGHVYVLSNIGSFGENIFKVGMTRRLEPLDRVKELGDASVPFPFDIHAMLSCDNAPHLERALHRALTRYRVNRINLRKEYFQVDLHTILDCVRRNHGEVDYVAEPEALEYRDSLEVNPDDLVIAERELEEMGVVFEETDE